MSEGGDGAVTVLPVRGLPEIRPGDDLAAAVAGAAALRDGDVLVVAQKVVSKAEGALVHVPAGEDRAAARARLVRREAVRLVAEAPWTTIVETRHGFVCANAGIDASNVAPDELALLPEDPDASARRLRDGLRRLAGVDVAVVVADTFGRPWRMGQTDVAIGAAGLRPLRDERGGEDRHGMALEVTVVAVADEIAAAADLVRRKADGVPAVVLRGLRWEPDDGAGAAQLVRSAAGDLFPRGRGRLTDQLAERQAPWGTTEPGSGGGVPGRDEWRRAVAAGLAVADRPVTAGPVGEGRVELATAGREPADLVALGAAAATVRIALLDLGFAATVEESGEARRVVAVGAPAPHRPASAGRGESSGRPGR